MHLLVVVCLLVVFNHKMELHELYSYNEVAAYEEGLSQEEAVMAFCLEKSIADKAGIETIAKWYSDDKAIREHNS